MPNKSDIDLVVRAAVVFSNQYAVQSDPNHISCGIQHLFMGLAVQSPYYNLIGRILNSHADEQDIDWEKCYAQYMKLVTPSIHYFVAKENIEHEVWDALNCAKDIANSVGHDVVTPEHLFLVFYHELTSTRHFLDLCGIKESWVYRVCVDDWSGRSSSFDDWEMVNNSLAEIYPVAIDISADLYEGKALNPLLTKTYQTAVDRIADISEHHGFERRQMRKWLGKLLKSVGIDTETASARFDWFSTGHQ
jgi:hypothetical protein